MGFTGQRFCANQQFCAASDAPEVMKTIGCQPNRQCMCLSALEPAQVDVLLVLGKPVGEC